MTLRTRKMVILAEELSIRTQRLQPTLKRMEQIARRMRDAKRQIERLKHVTVKTAADLCAYDVVAGGLLVAEKGAMNALAERVGVTAEGGAA